MRQSVLIVALFCVGALSACDFLAPEEPDRERYVVRMFLSAQEPLPPLILSTLSEFEDDIQGESVPDANVWLEKLTEADDVEQRWVYERRNIFNDDSTQLLGTHGPVREIQELAPVKPLARYRLVVELEEDDHQITSTTTVPDTFSVAVASHEALPYRDEEQLALELTESEYPNRDAFYIITNESTKEELSRDDFTPDAARLYPNVDDPDELERLRRGSSPVVNEAGYSLTERGFRRISVPWISFRFFGPNLVKVHALDDNTYDFMRTQQVQQGGSTLAPGETPNVIDQIDGGTGIFGATATASFSFTLLRNEGE